MILLKLTIYDTKFFRNTSKRYRNVLDLSEFHFRVIIRKKRPKTSRWCLFHHCFKANHDHQKKKGKNAIYNSRQLDDVKKNPGEDPAMFEIMSVG